jgi:hypothetical protein
MIALPGPRDESAFEPTRLAALDEDLFVFQSPYVAGTIRTVLHESERVRRLPRTSSGVLGGAHVVGLDGEGLQGVTIMWTMWED